MGSAFSSIREFMSKMFKGKEKNCLYVKYDIKEEDKIYEYHSPADNYTTRSVVEGNEIKVTIQTRNGWIELHGNIVSEQEKEQEERKGSGKTEYRYVPVGQLPLFDGLCNSQRPVRTQMMGQGGSSSIPAIRNYSGKNDMGYVEQSSKRNYPEPMETEESPKSILDSTWTAELQKFHTIKLLPVGNCGPLCDEIKKLLPACKFVDEGGQVTVIVIVKTTRIQSDAEMAIEHANIGSDDRHKTILMMFHSIAGSKTIEDMNNVMYNNPSVYKTFHVPFKRNW